MIMFMFLDLSVNFIDLKVISNYIILFPAVIIFFSLMFWGRSQLFTDYLLNLVIFVNIKSK